MMLSRSMMMTSVRWVAARRHMSSGGDKCIGLIGVGKMGTAMTKNFIAAGLEVVAYDVTQEGRDEAAAAGATVASSNAAVAAAVKDSIVISVLPNDTVLRTVSAEVLSELSPNGIHASVSTVSPHTSRELATEYAASANAPSFVSAPVFARPDGVAAKNGNFILSGPPSAVARVQPVLETTCASVFDFGEDPGAANVVKLTGNFMIASAIESIGEALAFAESNGADREQVMGMLSSTIFDCLIYKGYGNRVAGRKHLQDRDRPGFALELGMKDVSLVLDTARRADCPMPLGSLLRDRMQASVNAGRGMQDWSSIALAISQDAGTDVSEWAENPQPE